MSAGVHYQAPKSTGLVSTNEFDSLFVDEASEAFQKKPNLRGNTYLCDGRIIEWTGEMTDIHSPVLLKGSATHTVIGSTPMLTEKEAMECLDAAVRAYDSGRGVWPTMHVRDRIAALERFLAGLQSRRAEIVHLLMWEICKTAADSAKEVDRTIEYMQLTIKALKDLENSSGAFLRSGGVMAQVRRAPLGVVVCVGPFNYPFNETYTTLIPALIMGNTVVMKLPRVGVLCHWPTFELFRDCFPPGVINIVAGSGRRTLNPIMASGKVEVFAFIGTSTAADALQKNHPMPHRLRVCLGLEAKNPAIIFPDADIEAAAKECVLGSLSYNGQRCTAIKIIFVHKDIKDKFVNRFVELVDALKMGMPWDKDVAITPLPEEGKPGYLREVIADAVSKGATVLNPRGSKFDRTLVAPTVLFPVNESMRCYHEEQFGPLVPITTWENPQDIYNYLASSQYGQQAAVFSTSAASVAPMVDVLVNQVSRVNLNSQCQRGPDTFPFTGRKDSAYGTLSVSDALRVFSLRALVAAKETPSNESIVTEILNTRSSNFLRLDYMF